MTASSHRGLPLYRLRCFRFINDHTSNSDQILSLCRHLDLQFRNWEDAPCFVECQKCFSTSIANSTLLKSFVLRGGYCGYGGSYSPIIAIMLYPIIGSLIQFKFNEKTENSTEILHLLHLLWHIKDAVFIEKNCLLEFPLSRNLKALQASWGCGPLLKCTKSLELSDHAGFCGNIVTSSNEERLFVSPKIRINVSLGNMAFYSRRHFLRTMIQQQLSVDMPSDIDVSCGPLTMLVNPISDLVELCQIPDPEEYEQRDVLERRLDALGTGQNLVKCRDMAGEFSNACIRKTFHVLVNNSL